MLLFDSNRNIGHISHQTFGDYLKNKIPWLLCVAGGVMLIISGATGNIGFFDLIAEVVASIPELVPFLDALEIIRTVLGTLASFGGNTVLVGGFFLTIDRVRTGKILVGLGAGMGIFGLLINIGQIAYTVSFGASINWLISTAMTMNGAGVLLTILARMMAK